MISKLADLDICLELHEFKKRSLGTGLGVRYLDDAAEFQILGEE